MGSLCAVFFTDISACSAHVMARWANAGNTIAACVVSPRPHKVKWRRDRSRQLLCPDFSMRTVLGRNRASVLSSPRDLTCADFLRQLAALNADVLISSAYPNRIPLDVVEMFRCGGVNLHPALLPQYRGPHPIQAMAIDGALQSYAGVTLHRISQGFDEGEIIAQSAATEADLSRLDQHSIWCMRIAGELVSEALPKFCRDKIKSRAQATGDWRYARVKSHDLVLTENMNAEALRVRAHILGSMGQLRLLLDGKIYKIAGVSKPESQVGCPPRINWRTVEFDAADGRVCLTRAGNLERRFRTFADLMLLRRLGRCWQHTKKKAPAEKLAGASE